MSPFQKYTGLFIVWTAACPLFQNIKSRNGRLMAPAPRESHPRVVLTRPCSLPATPYRLNTAARSDCDCKGVSPCLCVVARGSPHPLCGLVWFAPPVPKESILAHPPYGSTQTGMYPSALCCAGIAGLSLSRYKWPVRAERGSAQSGTAWAQFRSKPRMAMVSFVSSLRRISSSTTKQRLPFWS